MPTLLYLPPTTEKEPKQTKVVMADLPDMKDADKFKAEAIKKDRELRKGAWFFGGVRI